MKALIFNTPGSIKQVLQLVDMPEPAITPLQVLVRVKARPVNPSDELFALGRYRKKAVYPQIAGLEGSGIIVECGADVTKFNIGDHVAFRAVGTWAEKVAIEEQQLIKIERPIPFEVSAQVALNGITAQALLLQSGVKSGELLLLDAAATSLSYLIIQLAGIKGIDVIALIREGDDAEKIIAAGASYVLRQEDEELETKLKDIIGEREIKCFLDAVGGPVLSSVIPLMGKYSKIIVYGNLSGKQVVFGNDSIIYKNLTIEGFGIDHWLSLADHGFVQILYNEIVEGVYQQKLTFRDSKHIPLQDVIKGFKDEGHKIIIV